MQKAAIELRNQSHGILSLSIEVSGAPCNEYMNNVTSPAHDMWCNYLCNVID